MACNTCKKKKGNNIKSLTPPVELDRLKLANDYVSIASKMNDEKWDYVEEVMSEIYPQKHRLNRQCPDCLRQMAKLVQSVYQKYR